MSCEDPRTIHTIGHSTRTIEAFHLLLKTHEIELLVDVRRWPASRRFPHFGRERLEASLTADGIGYQWREELGGYRKAAPDSPNTGWRVAAFRAYADFMMTPEFERILEELQQTARSRRIALMCAEAVPWRCHRQLLADALFVRDWEVRHILDERCEEHHLTPFAKATGSRILYQAVSGQQVPLTLPLYHSRGQPGDT
jgi:uncharacterized protein (DUF488 family)